jgi:hypothetical protein
VATYESELEQELEQELHELHEGEGESEVGLEGEGILGTIGSVLGGLLGEGEGESELHELHELHEFEGEGEGEFESELEGEFESGEQFFGLKKLLRRAAPLLRRVAKVAAPMVAKAIGGPAVGNIVGKLAGTFLEGEGELQELHEAHEMHELHEFEGEFESESEGESEIAHEIGQHELTEHEMQAEIMAHEAAQEQHEFESEALSGAAAVTVISPADRRALRRILPHMVRGVTLLTRILRRRRITRPAVRVVPTIVRRSVQQLKRQAASGTPVTRKAVATTVASQVRKVLGNPKICAAAVTRNLRTNRIARRPRQYRRVAG